MIFLVLALIAVPAIGSRLQPVPELLSESYIINGRNVPIESFPHQGSLRLHGTHSCGCALLGGVWALTAGHCIGTAPKHYTVMFGSDSRFKGVIHNVKRIYVHPDYIQDGRKGFPNDIAILKFDQPVQENSKVKRIRMASSLDGDFAGANCYITGWGFTTTGGNGVPPGPLQGAEIGVLSPEQCSKRWPTVDASKHVCVGGAGAAGSCSGDSGGPLTCQINGENVLVGVTSWGRNGCYTRYPSVYTRVSTYKPWVDLLTGRIK